MKTLILNFPAVRIRLIDYPKLRGERMAERARKGRMIRVCGIRLWVPA